MKASEVCSPLLLEGACRVDRVLESDTTTGDLDESVREADGKVWQDSSIHGAHFHLVGKMGGAGV